MKNKNSHALQYKENRRKFSEKSDTDALTIVFSNDEMHKSADQLFPFSQNTDLLYLCGLSHKDVILILCPQEDIREALIIARPTDKQLLWEGNVLTKDIAQRISGIENVLYRDELGGVLHTYAISTKSIFHDVRHKDKLSEFEKEFSQCSLPTNYVDYSHIFAELRMIKSDHEIQKIREACDVTTKAFNRLARELKVDIYEYQIEAEITHEFTNNGQAVHAYDPIVASGGNACVLHYTTNNKKCRDGELVLLDFGAKKDFYCGDLSRTLPINGTFTSRQRDVYQAVEKAFYKASQMLVTGNKLFEVQEAIVDLLESACIDLGLFTQEQSDRQKQIDTKNPLVRKYFPHSISHHLGLDVHDVSIGNLPLSAGMVVTNEPGLYIPEEDIGVRIESDFLITETGNEDLMSGVPIAVGDIEKLLK